MAGQAGRDASMRMRKFDQLLLIANPAGGGGWAGRWLALVAEALRESGRPVEAVLTRRAGDAREAAAGCAGSRPLVIAFGGDGTVNEVLNGADLDRCTLAVLPAGTGNVLAKEFGMEAWPPSGVRQLLGGRVVRMDVGVCDGRRFACMVGAGVDGHVVRVVHQRRRRWLTQLHYMPHLLGALFLPDCWDIAVDLDGERVAEGMDQVVLGNTHSYGGPIELTPDASPRDGVLDVMCLARPAPIEVPAVVPYGFFRRASWCPHVTYVRARHAILSSPRSDVPYQLDGEAAGFLPVEVELQESAARFLVPAGYREPRGWKSDPDAQGAKGNGLDEL
jgi:diacylglycerol kinase (ATP)